MLSLLVVVLCLVMLFLIFRNAYLREKGIVPTKPVPLDRRAVRRGNFLLIPLYVFAILLPFSYASLVEIPLPERSQLASGELTYRDIGRGDRLTGIKTASGTLYLSCASMTARAEHPNCLFPLSRYDELAGKPATAWWFEQPVYPFMTQKRLVRLVVAGHEVTSYEMTVRRTQATKKAAPWFISITLAAFIAIAVGCERMAAKQSS